MMWKNEKRNMWPEMIRDPGVCVLHVCNKFEELNPDRYQHQLYRYGRALQNQVYLWPDGAMSMDNEEYGIQVRFCPYCGVNLVDDIIMAGDVDVSGEQSAE
jgi:hypothetical protein